MNVHHEHESPNIQFLQLLKANGAYAVHLEHWKLVETLLNTDITMDPVLGQSSKNIMVRVSQNAECRTTRQKVKLDHWLDRRLIFSFSIKNRIILLDRLPVANLMNLASHHYDLHHPIKKTQVSAVIVIHLIVIHPLASLVTILDKDSHYLSSSSS